MASNTYDFSIPALGTQRVDVQGTQALIRTLSAAVDVELKTDTGKTYRCTEGQGFECLGAGEVFSWVLVRNLSASAITGTISIGDAGYIDKRITGTVQVIDGERVKVTQGYCFRGVVSQAGGGAGGALMQLFNPAGSLKNVYVQALRFGASAADTWNLFSSTTQGPTLVGAGSNVDRTQPGSAGATRSGNDATAYLAQVTHALGYAAASTDVVLVMPRPILLRPGYGLILQMNTLATALRGTFEWEEWPL